MEDLLLLRLYQKCLSLLSPWHSGKYICEKPTIYNQNLEYPRKFLIPLQATHQKYI